MKINLNKLNSPFLIAALGNPGEKYNKTRHNVGFIFLDKLAKQLNLAWTENKKLKCQIIKDGNLILAKPLTYMNNSGEAIQAIMSYYKMLPKKLGFKTKNSDLSKNLLVIHDDLDIEFNKYKFSVDSRSAGNNGVQSIIHHLNTKNFKRLRLGTKTDLLKHISAKDFVLQRFSTEEQVTLNKLINDIIKNYFSI